MAGLVVLPLSDSLRSKKHDTSQIKSNHGKLLSNNPFCSFLKECVEPTKSYLVCHADVLRALSRARFSSTKGEGYEVLKRLRGRLTQSNQPGDL